jgi:hypothetical protein
MGKKQDMDDYQKLLAIGKKNICHDQQCGLTFKRQLKDLHEFVYVVDSTPHPYERTYFPMFVNCIIHKDLWVSKIRKQLRAHDYSYDVINYQVNQCFFYHIPDTPKRRLLFEMVSQWWFFPNTLSPTYVRTEVVEFRNNFFKQKYAYLPEKFRTLTETMDFNTAMNSLTKEEHEFLDDFLEQLDLPSTICGCIPVHKSSFSKRFQEPIWYDLPKLKLNNRLLETDIREELLSGELLFLSIHNYHDGLDRNLYKKLYEIFHSAK